MSELRLLPGQLNLTVAAGNRYTVRLEWPTGQLAGRTFAAQMDERELGCVKSGDAVLVSWEADDTGAVMNPSRWFLAETTTFAAQNLVVGAVRTSPYGVESYEASVIVQAEESSLVVSVLGAPGATGPKGDTGEQGPVGDTGPAGAKGDTGPAGADSTVPGPAGSTGPQGPKGDTGAAGAAGAVGATGPQGPAGATGPQGPKGATGAPGADSFVPGPQGDTGPAGPKGDTGAAGAAGAKGDTGAAGAKGATGDTGAQGPKGDTGAAGAAGAKGATGDTGPAGAAGPKGDTGAAGAAGATGDTGPAGAKGATGDTGPAGAKGATGDTGPAGAKGATGDTGPAGAKGATGDTGPAGAKGATGDTGPAGAAGAAGATGATGPMPDPGSNGLLARTGAGPTYASRTVTGTANEISVANGDGVAGDPTLSLPSALTFTGKTVTGGIFDSATRFGISGSINVSGLPSLNGARFRSGPGGTYTVTDTTSGPGTISGNFGLYTFAQDQIATTASVTFSGRASTLHISGPPSAGSNVVLSSSRAIYVAAGTVEFTAGVIMSGSHQITKSGSTNTVEIANGTTTGQVSIGGGANTIAIGSRLAMSGSYNAPSTATTPPAFSIASATYTDTSSSGTVATNWGVSQIGTPTLAASGSTTYSGGIATLAILGAPVAGTNVTISGISRALDVTGGVICRTGLTVSGAAVSINASSNFGVSIGTGTSTGAIAIGGGSNTSIAFGGPDTPASFTVGTLPTASPAGRRCYASNARRITGTNIATGVFTTEGAGVGTGAMVESDGTNWKIGGTTVTAAA